MTEFILASNSKTRADMLENAGVSFSVQKPMVDEDDLKNSLIHDAVPARDIADALADAKARSVSILKPDALVLGADQVLEKDGNLYSKAGSKEEAAAVLKSFSASVHRLYSAAVVYQGGQPLWRFVDTAKMQVRPLSDAFIETYLTALGDDAFWSVGCYQLEGLGAQLFDKVDGSHFTVLGLPLLPLLDFLRRYKVVPL